MVHALPAILALIDYQSIASDQSLLFSNFPGHVENCGVISLVGQTRQARNFSFGNDYDVNRSLRCNVSNRKNVLILVNKFSRDLAIQNFCED